MTDQQETRRGTHPGRSPELIVRSLVGFDDAFEKLSGYRPMGWQRRLYLRLIEGHVPDALDLPTGLGKTSVMLIWLIA